MDPSHIATEAQVSLAKEWRRCLPKHLWMPQSWENASFSVPLNVSPPTGKVVLEHLKPFLLKCPCSTAIKYESTAPHFATKSHQRFCQRLLKNSTTLTRYIQEGLLCLKIDKFEDFEKILQAKQFVPVSPDTEKIGKKRPASSVMKSYDEVGLEDHRVSTQNAGQLEMELALKAGEEYRKQRMLQEASQRNAPPRFPALPTVTSLFKEIAAQESSGIGKNGETGEKFGDEISSSDDESDGDEGDGSIEQPIGINAVPENGAADDDDDEAEMRNNFPIMFDTYLDSLPVKDKRLARIRMVMDQSPSMTKASSKGIIAAIEPSLSFKKFTSHTDHLLRDYKLGEIPLQSVNLADDTPISYIPLALLLKEVLSNPFCRAKLHLDRAVMREDSKISRPVDSAKFRAIQDLLTDPKVFPFGIYLFCDKFLVKQWSAESSYTGVSIGFSNSLTHEFERYLITVVPPNCDLLEVINRVFIDPLLEMRGDGVQGIPLPVHSPGSPPNYYPYLHQVLGDGPGLREVLDCPGWRSKNTVNFYFQPAEIHQTVYHIIDCVLGFCKRNEDAFPRIGTKAGEGGTPPQGNAHVQTEENDEIGDEADLDDNGTPPNQSDNPENTVPKKLSLPKPDASQSSAKKLKSTLWLLKGHLGLFKLRQEKSSFSIWTEIKGPLMCVGVKTPNNKPKKSESETWTPPPILRLPECSSGLSTSSLFRNQRCSRREMAELESKEEVLPFNYFLQAAPCELHNINLGLIKRTFDWLGALNGQEWCKEVNDIFLRKAGQSNVLHGIDKSLRQKIYNLKTCTTRGLPGRAFASLLRVFADLGKVPELMWIFFPRPESAEAWGKAFDVLNLLVPIRQALYKHEFLPADIASLEEAITAWKSKCLTTFKNFQETFPNWEIATVWGLSIRTFGPPIYSSTQTFEMCHGDMREMVRHSNCINVQKDLVLAGRSLFTRVLDDRKVERTVPPRISLRGGIVETNANLINALRAEYDIFKSSTVTIWNYSSVKLRYFPENDNVIAAASRTPPVKYTTHTKNTIITVGDQEDRDKRTLHLVTHIWATSNNGKPKPEFGIDDVIIGVQPLHKFDHGFEEIDEPCDFGPLEYWSPLLIRNFHFAFYLHGGKFHTTYFGAFDSIKPDYANF